MYGPYGHSWMFDGVAGMIFGGLWMLLIWAIPILLVAVLLKVLFGKPNTAAPEPGEVARPTPLDLLKEAYARGEIDRETYLRKRDDLLEK